ncbi:MAG TPA: glycosyltransferase 87 family protein [Solirubrobacterales bacterium]|nr:glycosyltransferase 87 family protein [Solirubrobacterales bacterium]
MPTDMGNMQLRLGKWMPYALIGCLAAWLSTLAGDPADWETDAAPAVQALADAHVGTYLSAKAMMGPFATLVQAPSVAVSGAQGSAAYPWAVFPCLLIAGSVGLYLARVAARRGAGRLTQALIATLFLLNPLTFEAIDNGHPEEILTAALAVAAVAAAAEHRSRRTALLLGLAIASKQWAVIAILPALMALPALRLRTGAMAAAVASLLLLPGFVASPSSFLGVQGEAAGTGQVVTPWSAWYPAAASETEVYVVDGRRLVAEVENAPGLADPLSHPLIVLLALAVPLAVALRRGLPLGASNAFALLALLALMRCALDPVDNLYYHEPLLLALIGWDAFSCRGLPLRALAATGVALLFWQAWHNLSDPVSFNAVYLTFAFALGCVLCSSLFRPFRWTGVPVPSFFEARSPNFRD